jgi:hypothetical protein
MTLRLQRLLWLVGGYDLCRTAGAAEISVVSRQVERGWASPQAGFPFCSTLSFL